jgi:tetratricopeptide (TPR) repeat protein
VTRQRFIPLLVVVVGLLPYLNSFTGPFIYDDEPSILENSTIRHLWPLGPVLSPPHAGGITVEGRPLVNLSLAVNYAFGRTRVWGYHVANLAIHLLAGLTLLGVVRRTLLRAVGTRCSASERPRSSAALPNSVANKLALASALIWTVHPLQTESVTYIVQRAESIMGLFYLLTLYCFIRGTETRRPGLWYGLSVAACALGMTSKEVMITAPLLVVVYDRTLVAGSFREAWRRRWPLYLGLAATWILLGFVLAHGQFPATKANAERLGIHWWQYLATEPEVILHYLRLSVWPHPLCFDYYGWPTPTTWKSIVPPAVVLAILLGATIWGLKAKTLWGFWSAWFFLVLAPSSSVIPLDSPAYEHRMYLPLAGVVVLAVLGIHALTGRRWMAVVAVLVVGLGILTWQRNRDYRSELSIWRDTARKRPNNPRAYTNLGLALVHLGRVREAIGYYEQALRIKPDSSEARYNLEIALARAGTPQEAVGHYEAALRVRPDSAEAYENLGLALAQLGRTEEAIEYLEQAVRLKPDDADSYNNLAVTLVQLGRTREAIDYWTQALRIKPDDAEMRYNLGNAFVAAGQVRQAEDQWQQALALARLAGQAQLAGEIEHRLDLYRSGRAYHPSRNQTANPR